MKSPFDITYNDLIRFAESRAHYAERNIIHIKSKGLTPGYRLEKDLETAKTLLRLLKKHSKEKQGNLFQSFENLKP
jgi:hypothetical protein